MTPNRPFDLPAYLRRVGLAAPPRPTPAGLAELHQAHATRIPFENLDVLLGRPPGLDLDSLQAKLVRSRRGGYCFEQNKLLAAALEAVGFRVTKLAARVRYRATKLLPRTHQLLKVYAGGESFLADVGFGGDGLIRPVPLAEGVEARQFGWTYRLVREPGGVWVLQSLQAAGWCDLYAFTEEPQEDVDFEVANYYVSTHPDSPFTRTLAAQLPSPDGRLMLRNRELTFAAGEETRTRTLASEEVPEVLARQFGIDVPPGATFPDRPWGW